MLCGSVGLFFFFWVFLLFGFGFDIWLGLFWCLLLLDYFVICVGFLVCLFVCLFLGVLGCFVGFV